MIKKKYYYLISLLLVFLFPALTAAYFIWETLPVLNLIIFIIGITIIGSLWDIWAARHGRRDTTWLWQFNAHETLGIRFFGIPLEEYLFYLVTSLYIIFFWEGIKYSLSTGDKFITTLMPLLAVWSLLFISLPYLLRPRGDRIQ